MKTVVASSIIAIGLIASRQAHGQGHPTDIELAVPTVGGPIVTDGGGWVGQYAGRVFDDGVMPTSPPYTTGSPGFDSLSGTFPAGSTIRFDFVKPLLYWNGTALAAPNVAMTVDYQNTRFASITGGDAAGGPGFVISSVTSTGAFHEHMDFTLPNDAASGLYGIVLTLGPGGASTGFTTSDPFLVTFARGNVPDYTTGLSVMVDAAFAVPEPGLAVAALAVAAGGLAMRRCGRRATLR